MPRAGPREKDSLQQADRRLRQNATVAVFLVIALLILAAGVFSGRQNPFFRNTPQISTDSAGIYVWVTGSDELQDGLHRFSAAELQTHSWGENLLAALAKGGNPESPVQALRSDGKDFHPDSLPPVTANIFFQPIPINRAAEDVLVSLPGIGPVLAARIVQHREEHGPFGRVEQLLHVAGIGPKKYEALAGLVVLD